MSDLPYRDAAPKAEQDLEYFVKMKEGSDERGPYTLDALRSSYKKQLLSPTAMVRTVQCAEWKPLRTLLEGNPEPVPLRNFDTAPGRHEAWRAAPETSNNNAMIGLGMIVAGLALTAVSFSAGGSRGILFFGLVIAGAVRMMKAR
jgi:GYF domain 2